MLSQCQDYTWKKPFALTLSVNGVKDAQGILKMKVSVIWNF